MEIRSAIAITSWADLMIVDFCDVDLARMFERFSTKHVMLKYFKFLYVWMRLF